MSGEDRGKLLTYKLPISADATLSQTSIRQYFHKPYHNYGLKEHYL